MSYSFAVKAANKSAAIAAAAARLDEEIVRQPIHSKDRAAALANVQTHADLAEDAGPDEEVQISMHGSICTVGERVTNAGSGCSISVYRKPA